MQIKLIAGEERIVPALGNRLVLNGQKVDVTADQVYGFTCQTTVWEPADAEAKKVHKAAVDARTVEVPAEPETTETTAESPAVESSNTDVPQEG